MTATFRNQRYFNKVPTTVTVPIGFHTVSTSPYSTDENTSFGTLDDISGMPYNLMKYENDILFINVRVHEATFIWMEVSKLQSYNVCIKCGNTGESCCTKCKTMFEGARQQSTCPPC